MTAPRLAPLVEDYLAVRRRLGFQLDKPAALLAGFARYADQAGHQVPVTTGRRVTEVSGGGGGVVLLPGGFPPAWGTKALNPALAPLPPPAPRGLPRAASARAGHKMLSPPGSFSRTERKPPLPADTVE